MVHVYNPSSFPRQEVKTVKVFEKWLLYLVILSIAGIALYCYITNRGKDFDVQITAKNGAIEYRENEKSNWKEIGNLPLKIQSSYEIRTLGDSGATLAASDGSKVFLGSYSRIVLSRNQGEIDWVQTDGNSHHQVAKNADRKAYKVAISDGELIAQGTAFEVKISDADTTVLVFQDQIQAVYKDKSTANVAAGQKITINPVGKRVSEMDDQDVKESWTLNNLVEDQKNKLPIDSKILSLAGISEQTGKEDVAQTDNANDNNNNTNNAQPAQNAENKNTNSTDQVKLTLEAKSSGNGVLLNWTSSSADGWDSLKVLKGNQEDLTYPNESYRTLDKGSNSYLWEISDTQKYFFRLCAWNNSGNCVAYSNNTSAASEGSSSASSTDDNNAVSSTTSTDNTQNQTTNNSQATSGTTTRGKCEGSGGHWSESTKICKCPPNEVFTGGKCKKK